MAKKKSDKEIKRLKQKAKTAAAINLTLEKQVRKLEKKLNARKQQIADLQGRLGQTTLISETRNLSSTDLGDLEGTSFASSHRFAWRQHSYLRDRYEFYLDTSASKQRARHLANEDLKQKYGAGCGFTEEELSAILS